jgi:TonB family protein
MKEFLCLRRSVSIQSTAMTEHSEEEKREEKRVIFALLCPWRQKELEIVMKVSSRSRLETALLPNPRSRWKSLGLGTLVQALFIIGLIVVPLLFPERLTDFRHYIATVIMPSPPAVSASKPQPPKPPKSAKSVVPKSEPDTALLPVLEKPAIIVPTASQPKLKPAKLRQVDEIPEVSQALPAKNPDLALGSPSIPNLRKPREAVQTGGFGDPNGVAATGGTSGRGAVRQGLFADGHSRAPEPKLRMISEGLPQSKPVEILFKPSPAYTDLARSKRIEGEVLLEVLFSATGEITVQRIVRGLGYGLDESAQAAAAQIRFHPAVKDGQPVDSTAVVHIVFELAY